MLFDLFYLNTIVIFTLFYYNTMANKATRGEKMMDSFVFRCSTQDKAQLKMMAQEKGMSVSGFIRDILIRQRVLPTSWTSPDEQLI